jgi:hypothetical protein
MSAFAASNRFFVSSRSGKVIACPTLTSDHPSTGNILYSPNGTDFYVALGHSGSSSSLDGKYLDYTFRFEIPALELPKATFDYDSKTNTIVYNDEVYGLDESFDATKVNIIELKPVMRVTNLVFTHRGYIVETQNEVDRKVYTYFNGKPVTVKPGSMRARGDVETLIFEDNDGLSYQLDISGDNIVMTQQTATFLGMEALVLIPDEYNVTFADDLSTVSVSKK